LSEAQFRSLSLPAGSPGEIVVSGGHVLQGYLNGIGDEETKFRVAGTTWHRTGDCGYFDGSGRLWLLGRAAAVVDDDHGTLYPFAVECAARTFPGVARAALVARQGRRILFIQPEQGTSISSEQSVKQGLAWARLDEVRQIKEIPVDRRHNAKVDYTRLPAAGS
jgi:acyl-CoA synthetase (AMP-forming)/AMP-acid ligase II